ncbi:MAG: hypothetical protein VB070_01435 [Clostridiaceae bacterium]|nr:hypothetical protein [Clostridiaceae bacterium]
MVRIRIDLIKVFSYMALTIPVIIFIAGWLKLVIAIPAILVILVAFYAVAQDIIKQNAASLNDNILIISRKSLAFIIVTILIWCWLGGQGGFFYQTDDYNCRNAIFRDLINLDWPVVYSSTQASLVYYIAYWLVPALFGKVFGLLFGAGPAWLFANIMMLIWSCSLVFFITILLLFYVKAQSFRRIFLSMLVLVFFSGMDIIGVLLYNNINFSSLPGHLEWWSGIYQYSANTTQLFWVFNQSIPAWLGVVLLLNEKTVKNYAYLGFTLLAFSPLPFVGFVPFFIILAARCLTKAIQEHRLERFIRQILSVQNIAAFLVILPLYYLYYKSNISVTNNGFRFDIGISKYGFDWSIVRLILFYLLEFGILAAILYNNQHKSVFYGISVFSLCLTGLFRIGGGYDFTMRASIPALMVLMILALQELLAGIRIEKSGRQQWLCLNKTVLSLIIILILGTCTPVIQFAKGFHQVLDNNKIALVADNVGTFANKPIDQYRNFLAANYTQTLFFKYLAK